MNNSCYLGVDTGGTFTDFVLFKNGQIRIHKRLSTPQNPAKAILEGIKAMHLGNAVDDGSLILIHGTTVATNAALEGKGVKTAFITNRGFGDILSIGRQNRAGLYDLTPNRQSPPVPRELCLETGGRLDHQGQILDPLTEDDIARLQADIEQQKPEAIAINLLYSFLDDSAEKRIQQAFEDICFTTRSSELLAEYKEYERGMATWLNAWLGPTVKRYLVDLQSQLANCNISVMQSSGGTIAANIANSRAVNLLLSGPAGGLAAARFIGQQLGNDRLLTFDMGGTSTDVSLIDGEIQLTTEGKIAHYPVAVPMVNMHTIGAGGGSIAYIDEGGVLRVGPESAGAQPGPACYGKGGERATVTDANAVLGRLGSKPLLGGYLPLDIDASKRAIQPLADRLQLSINDTAQGIIDIANEHMTAALRVISIEKGHDTADFSLGCFGGAGGMHVCQIAQQLGINEIIVPVHGGVLSALGMLVAPKKRELSKTVHFSLDNIDDQTLYKRLQLLNDEGIQSLMTEGVEAHDISTSYSLDMRYQGQTFTINIPFNTSGNLSERFHQAHKKQLGHAMDLAIEIVNIRASLRGQALDIQLPSLAPPQNTPNDQEIRREDMAFDKTYSGPLIITEDIATTWVETGWQATRDKTGNLILTTL